MTADTPPPQHADDGSGLAARLLRLWPGQEPQYCLLCLDPDGIVVGVSGATEPVLGYPPGDLVGQSISRVFTGEDLERKFDELERDVARSVGYAENDRWHVRGDGTRIWIGGAITAIRGAGGELLGFVKIMRDRTDVRAQIDTLENRVGGLRATLERKDRQLTTLAHELANPLSPLLQACHLLGKPESAHIQQRLLDVIGRQLDTLRRLIGDLRAAASQHAQAPTLALQRFVLQELLGQVVDAGRTQAGARGQSLELLCTDVPIWLQADPARLSQVVLNLLTNALKYTPAGGRIWVKATIEADDAVIRVEDDGVGIAPEMLPRIFDLFTQETASQHLSEGGLGVGLSVVKQWIDLHGGTVEVRSDGRGKGSHFTVRLPLRR
ncbi:PAS domain-containing sensor histidine kinase [Ideonella sp. BN130291]|uniref:PAS domain-containing sensor histidine kinase n=1 Tax=Ideonella sp. BN130291 TaxID=3112940 RepID=UPI002E2714DF|nr:PAS domain-containing sensor histidine kinase [Ideonella sp. BN130291]